MMKNVVTNKYLQGEAGWQKKERNIFRRYNQDISKDE